MNPRNAMKAKSLNKRIHCMNLLADRIKQNPVATGQNMKGNTGESGSGAHIKKSMKGCRQNPR